MIKPNIQKTTVIQPSMPKYFRDLLNNLFELEKKIVNAIDAQQLQQEIEQQVKELNNKKQALEKIKITIKNKNKRRNKLLTNQIKNIQQSINAKQQQLNSIKATKRIIAKMKDCFFIKDDISGNDVRYSYEDPSSKPYNDTRTDVVAHISGTKTDNLIIVEVIKPIIRMQANNQSAVVQKGIVTVANKDLNKEVNHEKND